jgi:hypothetical protein
MKMEARSIYGNLAERSILTPEIETHSMGKIQKV